MNSLCLEIDHYLYVSIYIILHKWEHDILTVNQVISEIKH